MSPKKYIFGSVVMGTLSESGFFSRIGTLAGALSQVSTLIKVYWGQSLNVRPTGYPFITDIPILALLLIYFLTTT